ncbi:hypothetical protein VJ923_01590 [Adlercreutzia sp. R25]|uniref:Cytochrome c domain-containing protein n=1 Tax=Adlercreutzia shanghongiae TaxID=3111773 RepID=A0ABU6IYE4_9ACTN|nr:MULTISPECIES: hypothetical protein [unclassified Adlercreutzia]MEC4271851.1 hypothetical protein [Adlercreutzia sp. R25]MEC4294858.1 hypothetical protein [Adlercreutzia sp. R22]
MARTASPTTVSPSAALRRKIALLRLMLAGCLGLGLFTLGGCASNHPITKSGEQCASCHSDGRIAAEGAGSASAIETGLTFAVEGGDEVYLGAASVAEDGTIIPSRDRTLKADELGSVTVSSPGLYALSTGDIAGPSSIVLINATESGPTDVVVKL